MPINSKSFTYDADAAAVLRTSTTITSTAASSIIDLGAARWDGRVIVDVSALDVASTNEYYLLRIQVSNASDFGSGVVTVASLELGDSSVTGSSADSAVGRYEVGISNEVNGTTYRYARINAVLAGTTPSLTYAAYTAPGVR